MRNNVWEICKFWILQNEVKKDVSIYKVWEICKFWILQNCWYSKRWTLTFERYVNFEFYKTNKKANKQDKKFERYVNFEFYKTID